ncbi:class I SAM-dependent DNA methyltransferase [Polynucleobacter asymbioticus]|uniref:class I SAM-dependent DNA methyltransferase n=1 Tax=Polynucleobacter asymbioticus TaxID=576611 RepID=UPI0008F93719|nr:DNA methyltransferase [Polynucleobacter asymbioticus]
MADITINEVRRRLQLFAKEHENDREEKQYAQQFMRDFYACFGLSKSSASMFEKKVIKFGNARGYIDSFIPGVLLVEQKTTGEDLYKAYEQATDYAMAITNEFEKPQYILISDFQTFHLYNLHSLDKEPLICSLSEISKRADWFMFLVDKRVIAYSEELPINRKAVEQIAKLHDALLRANYTGRDLESFLTRLLFCLFADDTGIFGEDGQFKKLVAKTKEDGSDLGMAIAMLFQVLNTAHDKRQTNLDEALKAFEYVNGGLFAEQISIPSFDFDLRTILVKCSELDWSGISPAIFGAMFQSVLEAGATDTAHRKESRRELGAHYTSERNILKVIQPLFLDELHKEFEQAITKPKLQALYDKLNTLKFFDPACGCGNFLVIAYRELRRIENDVIAKLYFKGEQGGLLDVKEYCKVSIEQFYGIEIDEAAVHIARVAMYITDHQLNLESGNRFGETRATVPLVATPHIHCGNALRMDWNGVVKAEDCNYVFGNPPFIGYSVQSKEQKEDLDLIFGHIQGSGVLDYVCAWYAKAANYIDANDKIECAFVSTNSITQGEQPAVLWKELLRHNIVINFAHRTFKWNNEGRGVAAVHCVIIGFAKFNRSVKELFTYEEISGIAKHNIVNQINAYLVDANNILLDKSKSHISQSAPLMFRGSQPTDGGHLLLDDYEKENLIKIEPIAEKFINKFLMGEEFINGISRWCLWLTDVTPEALRSMPEVRKRLELVKAMRLASTKEATQKLAITPYLFGEIKQPKSRYLALPIVSSERREYIPIAYLEPNVISGNKLFCVPNALLSDFAIMTSSMHMAWMRAVCGRMKSDYSYSNSIVYNNFVWTGELTEIQINKITETAQAILDARNIYPNATLADLYDPLTMPVELVKAHQANNKAVDEAYGYKGGDDDASRVAFLFKRYEELTSLLPATVVKKKRAKKQDDGGLLI